MPGALELSWVLVKEPTSQEHGAQALAQGDPLRPLSPRASSRLLPRVPACRLGGGVWASPVQILRVCISSKHGGLRSPFHGPRRLRPFP